MKPILIGCAFFLLWACSPQAPDQSVLPTDSTTVAVLATTAPVVPTVTLDQGENAGGEEAMPTEETEVAQAGENLNFGVETLDPKDAPPIPDIVRNQQWPLETTTAPDGSITRTLLCVGGDFEVQKIQFTENVYTIISIPCWYVVNGEIKGFLLPVELSDGKSRVIPGTLPSEAFSPELEQQQLDHPESTQFHESILGAAGWTGPGHIFVVSADQADSTLGVYGDYQGLGYEELSKVFIEKLFLQFGATGDPTILGNAVFSPNIGMNNVYNK